MGKLLSAGLPWGHTPRQRLLAGALIPGVGEARAVSADMARLAGDPAADPHEPPPALTPAAREKWRAAGRDPRFAARVAAERAALERLGAWYLTPIDPRWRAPWPTGILRGRGRLPERGVAIVGARRADRYGLDVARRVARAAVLRRRPVVSGGAFGVDHAAHRATLDAGGRTVVVLGSGLSHPAPARHQKLFTEALERGAVVSPFPCDQRAAPWTFPRRNPWIAALAEAVVVVQAGARSGALHTARAALERDIPVYAAPGPMDAPLHAGCHALIAEGARVLTAPDAWTESLGGDALGDDATPAGHPPTDRRDPLPDGRPPPDMPPDQRALWLVAGVEPRPIAELAEDAGLAIDRALQSATLLELDGWLRSASGGRYARGRPG